MKTKPILTPAEFAAALKSHRERLRLTQPQAAALAGVSPRWWWARENTDVATSEMWQTWVLAKLRAAKTEDPAGL